MTPQCGNVGWDPPGTKQSWAGIVCAEGISGWGVLGSAWDDQKLLHDSEMQLSVVGIYFCVFVFAKNLFLCVYVFAKGLFWCVCVGKTTWRNPRLQKHPHPWGGCVGRGPFVAGGHRAQRKVVLCFLSCWKLADSWFTLGNINLVLVLTILWSGIGQSGHFGITFVLQAGLSLQSSAQDCRLCVSNSHIPEKTLIVE